MAKRTLQELTIKNNFLFAAVMMEGDNSKAFLSWVLGKKIRRVEISYEKSIVYHPEQKGIRLDVFCEDDENTRYNVEMQVLNREILKRARYYHGQIDMELLLAGLEYEELPDSYVIFICDFDPFKGGKYRYTVETRLKELPKRTYNDGAHTIFLSTKGRNDAEVPGELAAFLRFAGASLEESEADFGSELVKQFQDSVHKIKSDREMRSRFMLFEEMMRDEYKAGRAAGIAEGIEQGRAAGEESYLAAIVRRKKAQGYRIEQIVDFLGEETEKIAAIYNATHDAEEA